MGLGGVVMGVLWRWDDLYGGVGMCFRVYMAQGGLCGLYGAGRIYRTVGRVYMVWEGGL